MVLSESLLCVCVLCTGIEPLSCQRRGVNDHIHLDLTDILAVIKSTSNINIEKLHSKIFTKCSEFLIEEIW
jgi:hypothetical protein